MGKAKKLLISGSAPNQTTLSSYFNRQPPSKNLFTLVVDQQAGGAPLHLRASRSTARASAAAGTARPHAKGRGTSAESCSPAAAPAVVSAASLGSELSLEWQSPAGKRAGTEQVHASGHVADSCRTADEFVCIGSDDEDVSEIVTATPEQPRKKSFSRSFLSSGQATLAACGPAARPAVVVAAKAHTTRPHTARPSSCCKPPAVTVAASLPRSACSDSCGRRSLGFCTAAARLPPNETDRRSSDENVAPAAACSFGLVGDQAVSSLSLSAAPAADTALSKRAAEKGCSPQSKKIGFSIGAAAGKSDAAGSADPGRCSGVARPGDRDNVRRAMLKLKPAGGGSRRCLSAEMSTAVKGRVLQPAVVENDVHLNDVLRELGDVASSESFDSRRKSPAAAANASIATGNGDCSGSCSRGSMGSAVSSSVPLPSCDIRPSDTDATDNAKIGNDEDVFLHAIIADLNAASCHQTSDQPSSNCLSADGCRRLTAAHDVVRAPHGMHEEGTVCQPNEHCPAVASVAASAGSACANDSVDLAAGLATQLASRTAHLGQAVRPCAVAARMPAAAADDVGCTSSNDCAGPRQLGLTATGGLSKHEPSPYDGYTTSRPGSPPLQPSRQASTHAIGTSPSELQGGASGHGARVDYGRHVVRDRQESSSGDVVLLLVESSGGGAADPEPRCTKRCVLQGSWSNTLVRPGDIVNVVGSFDPDTATCVIDDKNNFIIVHPDRLMSGTSIVSAVGCLRRAVLNEQCKGLEPTNASMLVGSIIHAVFQEVLRSRLHQRDQIRSIAQKIVRSPDFLHDMLICGVTEQKILQEMEEYIPNIELWFKRHISGQPPAAGDSDHALVQRVMDIEENVWCPRFGIKGKIDVTLDVKIRQMRAAEPSRIVKKGDHSSGASVVQGVLPLEVKTGKATFSSEHRGQVVLYTMMLSDRRNEDISSGLLLYLKHDLMKEVKATHAEKRGLIQLRNELCYYASARAHNHSDGKHRLPSLAPGINVESWCSRCPQVLNCTLYQRVAEPEAAPSPDHPIAGVFQRAIEHLSSAHVEYFAQWLLLLRLEADYSADSGSHHHHRGGAAGASTISDMWCASSADREQAGSCIGSLRLKDVTAAPGSSGSHAHRFVRATSDGASTTIQPSLVSTGGLQQGDSVVVSREDGRHVCLAQGLLTELTSEHALLQLDRDLRNYDECYTSMYRIDRQEYSSDPMTTNYCNLSSLMLNDSTSQKLRELIVDGMRPQFEPTLSKSQLHTIKPLVSGLNKAQKGAILKALMCRDYVLISGYPGTGKTSTIAALVQSLAALNRSVLIVSYTNSAVDTILLKLAQGGVDFVRCGKRSRMHADLHQYSLESLSSGVATVDALKRLYEGKLVVASTCHSIAQVDVLRKDFDVCIVDEASQTLQPSCVGALLRAKRFVLVGDDMQLPPIVTNPDARRLGMEESMFTRLRKGEGTLFELTEQYRMNSEIMRLANELVYNSRLSCGSEPVANATIKLCHDTARTVAATMPWLEPVLSDSLSRSIVFLDVDAAERVADDTGQQSQGIENVTEARVVRHVVSALAKCGLRGHEIGVITPFRAQVRLIQRTLLERAAAPGTGGATVELTAVEVSTVDQYQGRDKSVIVMSFVKDHVRRACDESEAKGILDDIRRLNVALTRSRHKLVLVGCSRSLTSYRPLSLLLAALRPEQLVTVKSELLLAS